jgi:SAM-dependent methyltransferase
MTSPWSGIGSDFLSEGTWAIGQGPGAPDRRLVRYVLAQFVRWLPLGSGRPRLLEIGPGSGIDLAALAEAGILDDFDYRGVDVTPELVEYLRVRFPGLAFEVGDVLDLDETNTADVVYARHVLEHVEDGERALRNLFRAAETLLVISWFIRPSWDEREVGTIVAADGFLHQTYSARRLSEIVRALGAYLYRFDFDHHSTRASVWVIASEPFHPVSTELPDVLVSPEFLGSLISPPEDRRERERELADVLAAAADERASVAAVLGRYLGLDDEEVAEHHAVRALDRAESAVRGWNPLRRYGRIVLWGFTDSYDSIRHIYRHYRRAAERLGKETAWLPDAPSSLADLRTGDLVFGVDVEGHALRAVPDVDYVLHNFDGLHPVFDGLRENNLLRLQVFTRAAEQYGVAWDPVRRYDRAARTLFQPWGTDLFVDEFLEPAYAADGAAVFVGAVWDDGGLGNVATIEELEVLLAARGIALERLTHITDEENVAAVRRSRIAPAFAGAWQVENDYLPCRVFKNVSYGKVAMTNVPRFERLFAGARLEGTIEEIVDTALGLSEAEHAELVVAQQAIVARYTYRESLAAIGRALEEGK